MWTEPAGPPPLTGGDLARLPLLSLAGLATAGPGSATGPFVDPRELATGMVHFGLGAFHRAHQAVFTEDAAAAAGDSRWGILGVTGRSNCVADTLAPQDGLYTVLTKAPPARGDSGTSLRIVGSLRSAVSPGRDTPLVIGTLADPKVHLATLTITEKGYPRDASGHLLQSDPAVASDTAALQAASRASRPFQPPARTPLGLLTRGLYARYRAGGAPLSVLCCDNLNSNGVLTRSLVTEFAASASPGFVTWLEESISFPSSMVDRIVPATTETDRTEAAALLGMRDEGLVVAEPFGQWVLQDSFSSERPAWERAGALFTSDVGVYELAKLRILNGTHSLLAYLGALQGHATIASAACDPSLASAAEALQAEAIRTLQPPAGMDLRDYARSVLARFRNPALAHTTAQVAMDGSEKLPIRALGTAADLLAQDVVPDAVSRLVAAWMAYVYLRRDVNGKELPLNDPLAGVITDTAGGTVHGLADRLFGLEEVFPRAVAGHPGFRSSVNAHLSELLRRFI